MKYRLTFRCDAPVELPVQYNKILQASLLNWLGNKEYADFLHNQGYENEKRTFKHYTFSNIIGPCQYEARSRKLVFNDKIQIYLSFYTDESHEFILDNIKNRRPLHLGRYDLELQNCELAIETYADCVVDTVSPVTIHSTLELPNGKKKTYYYAPQEKDFSDMIRDNLVRKYVALYGCEPDDSSFEIIPQNSHRLKQATINYNRFIIKGWSGRFVMRGSTEMIKTALLSGIGARNGIGMGCLVQKEVL